MAADIEPFAANVYAYPDRLCHTETPCLACAGLRPQATVRVVTEGDRGHAQCRIHSMAKRPADRIAGPGCIPGLTTHTLWHESKTQGPPKSSYRFARTLSFVSQWPWWREFPRPPCGTFLPACSPDCPANSSKSTIRVEPNRIAAAYGCGRWKQTRHAARHAVPRQLETHLIASIKGRGPDQGRCSAPLAAAQVF